MSAEFSGHRFCEGIRRGGPGIIAEIKFLPERHEFLCGLIDKFLDGDVFSLRGLLDLLAMLIHTGEKERRLSFQPMVSGDDIGKDLLIGMAEMRRGIRVVDRCRNEERLHFRSDPF